MTARRFYYIAFFILVQFVWAGPSFGQVVNSDASVTGISRAFNPAISLNGLFYAMASSKPGQTVLWKEMGLEPGLHLQELSLEFTANVDIYFKAQAALSAGEYGGVQVEEAYLSTLRMPVPVTIRGGKMLNSFGRHNLLHTHHFAFAEPPMIQEQIFGPDLDEVSVEASYLVPVPWYMEILGGWLNGDNQYLFNADSKNHFGYLAHLDNLWDLTDEITLRLGGSYLGGDKGLKYADGSPAPPEIDKIVSEAWGADFQLKWRPLEHGRYKSLTFQGEYMGARLNLDGHQTDPMQGIYAQVLGQFKLKWWLQGRYDWFNRPSALNPYFPEPVALGYDKTRDLEGQRYSVALAYVPTEFSAFRAQYNHIILADEHEDQFLVQVNFTIGSHPAHKY